MNLMADGLWVSGKSHADVAFEFGVSPATVKDWATSASRVLRLAVESDPDELRARLVTTLENIVAESMQTKKAVMVRKKVAFDGEERIATVTEMMPAPSLDAAVNAVRTHAQLLGLIVQKTQDVPITEEQARAKFRELTGKDWGT